MLPLRSYPSLLPLRYAQLQPWRPWRLRSVPAGYVTIYAAAAHNLTFLTVKGSGHMVPQYQPDYALYPTP